VLVAPGVKGFFEPGLGSGRKLRGPLCVGLRCRSPRGLPQGQQLPPVLRAGLAYPVMELQLNSGRERERLVHGFGREPCHVAAGRSDVGEPAFHSATASTGTFFLQIIAEDRAWHDRLRRLSSVVGLCFSKVASRLGLIRGAGV